MMMATARPYYSHELEYQKGAAASATLERFRPVFRDLF